MARYLVALTLAGILSQRSTVEAQILTGRILGVVRDESGGLLTSATATLESPALPGGPIAAVTNARGEFSFTQLDPGVYQLSLAVPGFRSHVEQDLRVSAGGTIERTIILMIGALEDRILVSGQAPVVDSRRPGVAHSLPVEAVEAIPHNRQGGVVAFMVTMPGVTSANYNRIASAIVMGSNANETSYMSDGILTNSVLSGNGYGYLDQDAIQEMNAVTLGASAEYQQAQGGVMNMITKAGTNEWRGDGLYYWAPSALTSAPITLRCNCPLGESGFKLYKYLDFGAHAGGPILKDRLWYFGGVSNAGPSARFPGAPDTPEELRWTRDEYRSNHKFTLKINSRINFSQVFYYEWWHWSVPDFPTTLNPLETVTWYTGDIRAGAAEMTATVTPSMLLTARYSIYSTPFGNVGFGPNFTKNDLRTPARFDVLTGATTGNAFADAHQPRRDDFAVKINRDYPGEHIDLNLRFGVQLVRNRANRQDVWPGGVQYRDYDGAPFEAVFTPPGSDATQSVAQGVWAESEMTIGDKLTIVPAVRFDRMTASSPSAPFANPTEVRLDGGLCRCVISFPLTGEKVPGLGDLFTWTSVSPRFGLTLKLTDDGKTVLRATAGRYYRPIFLNEFTGMHPGNAASTLAAFDPTTSEYITVSVTDPRSNIAIDPHIAAPYTDQYSIGVDWELTTGVAARVTYVRKDSQRQIGWIDSGGAYGEQTVIAPDGRPITVFPLLNSPRDRRFVRTNGPGYFGRYQGLIVELTRRYANRWTSSVSYSYSIAEGLQPIGATGRDPNDLIDLDGRLEGNDRPHILNASGAYEIPKVGVQLSGNLTVTTGRPYGAQFQLRLPQGLRSVFFEAPGSYRRPGQQWLHMRVNKTLYRRGSRHLELGAEIRNVLQETDIDSLVTQVFSSPNFGAPGAYAIPRQLMFRVRGYF